MRWAVAALLAALCLGCRGKVKAPPTAPAPSPVAVASAEPLSIPQTSVRLPPAQPVPPEAVPPEPEAAPENGRPATVEAMPAARPVSPPSRPRPQPPAVVSRTPVQASPPAARQSSTGLRPLLTPEQEQALTRRIDESLSTAERLLASAQSRNPSADQKGLFERVRALIDQARRARQQGDLEPARSLAERAEVMASDLARKQ